MKSIDQSLFKVKGWLLLAVLCVGGAGVSAAEPVELKKTLLPLEQVALAHEPLSLFMGQSGLLVNTRDSETQTDRLTLIDPVDLTITGSFSLDGQALDIVQSVDQELIIIIESSLPNADDARQSTISVLDANLNLLGSMPAPTTLVSPVSYITSDKLYYLYDRAIPTDGTGNRTSSKAFVMDFLQPKNPKLIHEIALPEEHSNITDFWIIEEGGGTLVMNSAEFSRIEAYEIETFYPLDNINYSYRTDSPSKWARLLTVFSLLDHPYCQSTTPEDTTPVSFLLVNNATFELVLADFDQTFRSLEVRAITPIPAGTQETALRERLAGTNIPKPTTVLSASCDLSVIWVGDTFTNHITQLARNPDSSLLETVGSINLEYSPTALLLSDDGETGYAISRKSKALTLLAHDMPMLMPVSMPVPIIVESISHADEGSGRRVELPEGSSGLEAASQMPPPLSSEISNSRQMISLDEYPLTTEGVSGSESIRLLQRVLSERGYPVGAIDGFYGDKTRSAVELYERVNEISLDVQNSIRESLELIESTPSKY